MDRVRAGGPQTICQGMFRPCNNEVQIARYVALRFLTRARARDLDHPADQYLHGAMQLEAGKRKAYLSLS